MSATRADPSADLVETTLAKVAAAMSAKQLAAILTEAAALRGTEFLHFLLQIAQASSQLGNGVVSAPVQPQHRVRQIGKLTVDPARPRSFMVDGRRAPLGPTRGPTLQLLAAELGKPVSADRLMQTLWLDDWGNGHDREVLLQRLRQVIHGLRRLLAGSGATITYEPDFGYVLEEEQA